MIPVRVVSHCLVLLNKAACLLNLAEPLLAEPLFIERITAEQVNWVPR